MVACKCIDGIDMELTHLLTSRSMKVDHHEIPMKPEGYLQDGYKQTKTRVAEGAELLRPRLRGLSMGRSWETYGKTTMLVFFNGT